MAQQELQLLELGPDLTVYIGAERDARFIYKEIYGDNCYDIAQLPANACRLRHSYDKREVAILIFARQLSSMPVPT